MNAYLIGEKINTGGRRVSSDYGQLVYRDPKTYWAMAMRGSLGGFWWYDTPYGKRQEESCWKKMRSILGNLEVQSFNMLVPSPIVGSWSVTEADRAADCLIQACPRPSLLVCCGTRVSKAIWRAGYSGSYPTKPGLVEQIDQCLWMTRIPHPSGRNNGIWYNEEVIKEARENFAIGMRQCQLDLTTLR